MIEYKTWPYNTDQWKREKDQFFYLELFGETSPQITPRYTQLPLLKENEISRHSTNIAPLYEYYWSLGYVDIDKKCGPDSWGGNPKETAAEVYMYFPTTGGWWMQELVATVKYLIPGTEHLSVLRHVAQLFSTAQPIVEDVSKIASAGSGLPGVGPIAASSAALLDVIAKLKLTSVPPVEDYTWSVQKVAEHIPGEGILHGIKWTIPKEVVHRVWI